MNQYPHSYAYGTKSASFQPSDLPGLVLWCRNNSGITVTGSGVSQWDDVSGQDNHLLQSTDTNRPSKESDGSILFNGSDNYIKANAFTLVQPTTVYWLGKTITFTDLDVFFDGNTNNDLAMRQRTSENNLQLASGGALGNITALPLDTYGILACVFDSPNCIMQLNEEQTITGDSGTDDAGGFTMGRRGTNGNHGHCQVKEVIVYNIAHDAATRSLVIAYLAGVGGLVL